MVEKEDKRATATYPLEYADDVQEIFVDGFQGVTLLEGVIRVNLWQTIFQPSKEPERVRRVVARMLMPAATFIAMHRTMGTIVSDMTREGAVEIKDEGPSSHSKLEG